MNSVTKIRKSGFGLAGWCHVDPKMLSLPSVGLLCCAATTTALLFEPGELTWHWAAVPVLVALTILVTCPGPGRGAGKPASSLSSLRIVHPAGAKLPMGKGCVPQKGRIYVICFYRNDRRCSAHLKPVELLWRKCTAEVREHCSFVLVSRDPEEEALAFAKRFERVVTVPTAYDHEGVAAKEYMGRHRAIALPHAFVVDSDGIIRWHGHPRRAAFATAVQSVTARPQSAAPATPGKKRAPQKSKKT